MNKITVFKSKKRFSIKLILLSCALLTIVFPCSAQWTTLGVNTYISGNVGIGTTSPSTPLQVIGTVTAGNLALTEGANTLAYLGRGASITSGYATTPDVLALTYMKRDFAIGGWAKTGAAWKGISFYINSDNGFTGIGTTTPSTQLQVAGTTTTNMLLLSEGTNSLAYLGRGASITAGLTTTPEVLALTYIKRDFAIGGWAKADGGWQGVSLYINSDNGYTGIGTNSPDQKLTVNGTVHAKEIKVDAAIPTPDYVFDSDYKLATLAQVKAYITHYHHLPDVPSADQVAKEGIVLGEMNQRLLKKVEELTLYLINKDDQVKEMQKEIKEQKIYNKSLENRLLKLESETDRK